MVLNTAAWYFFLHMLRILLSQFLIDFAVCSAARDISEHALFCSRDKILNMELPGERLCAFVLVIRITPMSSIEAVLIHILSSARYKSTCHSPSLPTWDVRKLLSLCQSDKWKMVSPVVLICISHRRLSIFSWICKSLSVNCSALCCWAVRYQVLSLYV